MSRKGKTLKELQRSGSADWPNIESLRFLPFLRQLAEEYGDGAEGDTMRAAAETIATQRARNEALDDYCEKLRYQTVNQDAVIANQQARIEVLKEALLEAAEEIDGWGQYAGEYFMKKHDLAGTVKRLEDLAEQEGE